MFELMSWPHVIDLVVGLEFSSFNYKWASKHSYRQIIWLDSYLNESCIFTIQLLMLQLFAGSDAIEKEAG